MTAPPNAEAIVALEQASRFYQLPRHGLRGRRPVLRAVDGVSLAIEPGRTLGLVGESGSGKTTVARLVLRLERPDHGRVTFEANDVATLSRNDDIRYRRTVQAVLQDPSSSLDPRMRVRSIVAEPLVASGRFHREEVRARVAEVLGEVGLEPAAAERFPHEFSGGQRQRIAIARALAPHPKVIVLDEPVSSLDVSIGAQIINLLKDLQSRLGIAYLLIAHNLALVRSLSHRVAVMYLGQIVETGGDELFDTPAHPYTRALLEAVDPAVGLDGIHVDAAADLPSPLDPPAGCSFHTRCPHVFEPCGTEEPLLRVLGTGRAAACHLHDAVRADTSQVEGADRDA